MHILAFIIYVMPIILENIEVWNKAVQLAKDIRKLCKENNNLKNDFGMRDQLQRSATSIASNIAEGKDRNSDKDFLKFLTIARWSTSELKTQLYIVCDEIDSIIFQKLLQEITNIHKMLNWFIKTLKQ